MDQIIQLALLGLALLALRFVADAVGTANAMRRHRKKERERGR